MSEREPFSRTHWDDVGNMNSFRIIERLEQENAALREGLKMIVLYDGKTDDMIARTLIEFAKQTLSGNPSAKTGPEN
jgi:hypothetical protein